MEQNLAVEAVKEFQMVKYALQNTCKYYHTKVL